MATARMVPISIVANFPLTAAILPFRDAVFNYSAFRAAAREPESLAFITAKGIFRRMGNSGGSRSLSGAFMRRSKRNSYPRDACPCRQTLDRQIKSGLNSVAACRAAVKLRSKRSSLHLTLIQCAIKVCSVKSPRAARCRAARCFTVQI